MRAAGAETDASDMAVPFVTARAMHGLSDTWDVHLGELEQVLRRARVVERVVGVPLALALGLGNPCGNDP